MTVSDRIRALGAPVDRVSVSGNMKYDQALPAPTPLSNWLEAEVQRRGRHPVIVAGSVVASAAPSIGLTAPGLLAGICQFRGIPMLSNEKSVNRA